MLATTCRFDPVPGTLSSAGGESGIHAALGVVPVTACEFSLILRTLHGKIYLKILTSQQIRYVDAETIKKAISSLS